MAEERQCLTVQTYPKQTKAIQIEADKQFKYTNKEEEIWINAEMKIRSN